MHAKDKKAIPAQGHRWEATNSLITFSAENREFQFKTDTAGNPELRMFKEKKTEMDQENSEEITEQKFFSATEN